MNPIKCPYCGQEAKLVNGQHVYPHRPDLKSLNFWACDPCDAYVGCHKEGATFLLNKKQVRSDGTMPLGRLADARLRRAKSAAHAAFDPIWKGGSMSRHAAYAWLAEKMNLKKDDCHIGMMDADACYTVVQIAKGHA
jgi:hypothetical protein